MELLQLKYFCDSAETENFSKTAQKFYVPPSNISQSINRLEKELGIKLFDRSSNKIMLNKNGIEFYKRIKQALFLIDDAKKAVTDDEMSGEIRICVRTNRRIVTDITEKFKNKYPEVSFVINHSIPENTYEYDFIIADSTLEYTNLKKELFIEEDILLAINKDNPIAKKEVLSKDELESQKFITISQPSNLYTYTLSICNSMGFKPDITIQSDDPYFVRKYVSLGWGISFIPSFSWEGLFNENIILKKIGDFKRKTYIMRNENKYMPKRAKLFYDTLKTFKKKFK